jgi:hypothetical protein
MSDISLVDPDSIGCCDPEVDPGDGYPAEPPPCTYESCSIGFLPMTVTRGALGAYVRLFGQSGASSERLPESCDPEDECGLLRCYIDSDGKNLGLGISLKGSPAALEVDCTDEEGNDLYVNGLRAIKNPDGSCSLGTLPIPLQGKVCVDGSGQCTTTFPPGQEGDVFGSSADGGCGPNPCVSLTNEGCFPMVVTPKITITGARLGPGVTYQIQPNVQGNFEDSFDAFSNNAGDCTVSDAGTGATSSAGDPEHTHEGPSHSHTVNCNEGDQSYSGTIDRPLIQLGPGETLEFCASVSIRYDRDNEGGGLLNFGTVNVCLDYSSLVTPETIAALEGN